MDGEQGKGAGAARRASSLFIWGALAVVGAAVALVVSLLVAGGPGTGGGPAGPEASQRPYVGGDLHAMAVDPKNPERVMVGGHGGAAVSEDGGRTWRQIADLEGADPMGWVIDPRDPRKMYAAGHPGFFRSGDGGGSWTQDNSGLPGTDVHALGIDPQNPDTLYAFIVGSGLYGSPDGGESWNPVNPEMGVMGPILVDPRDPETLYAAVEDAFLKSEDRGESWRRDGAIPGGMAMWISQDRQNPGTFYAATGQGVLKSADGGETWRQSGEGLPGGVSVVEVAPGEPNVVYAGALEENTATVYRSEDGGKSWQGRN